MRKRKSAMIAVVDQGSEENQPSQSRAKRRATSRPSSLLETCTIHRVHCNREKNHTGHPAVAFYQDTPRLFTGDSQASALRGKHQIVDVSDFLEAHSHLGFVLYRIYNCHSYHDDIEPQFRALERPSDPVIRLLLPYFYRLDEDGMPADSHEEAMVIASEDLRYALHGLTDIDLNVLSELDNPENMRELVTRIYHYRSLREDPTTAKILDQQSRDLVISLIEFMETIFGQEYDEADELFSKGLVTKSHLPKLFAAQDLLVTTEQGQLWAYTLDSFPGDSLKLFCWAWGFDGQFWRHRIVLSVESPDTEDPIKITDLSVYPLKYATTDIQELLQSRGRQYWSLRNGGYVSYTPTGIRKDTQTNKPRYMVDVTTYQELHSSKNSHDSDREREYLSAEAMEADEPPEGNFLLLLPATIHGYGFQDKKWRLLHVSQISAIEWNKKAFDHLVLQSTKKELIRALVKKHDSTNESTDVIEGKGNGLILLLHGGPGTGKTLTAESVAELTRRPLYRVTCGDVGTNAEEVEEYLESVLHLGKIWRCVVLLDEADVFLEERTQQDLKRNALVSVFLRVIEYYDGILVLTSNRIGTFDEAFKSRMQLIVHYPTLQQDERRRVWANFITGLQNSRVKARIAELQERIGDLSQFELNGREIRNTIQTATLLAQFRKKRLCYEHLTDVIATSEEFKDYLRETRGHDESDYMRFKQIRRE